MEQETNNIAPDLFIEREKVHQKSLTLIIIFLCFVLVLGVILLVVFKIDLTKLNLRGLNSRAVSLNSLVDQTETETVALNITERQLADVLGVKNDNFPLDKASLQITADNIKISGKTGKSFFALGLDFFFRPKVSGGKLTFELEKVETAGVPAPKKVTETFSSQVENALLDNFPINDQIEVTEAILGDGFLVIEGRKKL